MLQLHDIIQQMPINKKTEGMLEVLKKINDRNDLSRFDFGDVDNFSDKTCMELMDYAYELAQHDMFELPFNPVYYSWTFGGAIYSAFITMLEKHVPVALFFVGDRKPLQMAIMGHIRIEDFGKMPRVGEDTLQLIIKGQMLYKFPDVEFSHNKAEEELYQMVSYFVLVFTALMESSHVKTRKTEIGEKLNKKREKRGLPKIMPFHTVYFEVDGKEYSTGGVARGGSSSQKSMHWRRGHIRRLASGKITHVRPCLVGAIETETHVPKPAYSMKRRGHAA
jgi:hypothetical protein